MDSVFSDVFTEISVILILAAAIGAIGLKLRQPLIVSFIAVGILVGPSGLDWVAANDQVDLLAKLGIALLLFLVGLKLDLHIIKTMGPVALAAGLGQVFFTSVFGFFIAQFIGLDTTASIYVAVALTFSSTIIIVKLLSDKKELDHLHGRIAIGFLIVQDIVVVLVMIFLTAMGEAESDHSLGQQALSMLLNGALFLIAIGVAMRFLLTPLMNLLSKSSEMLILFSIGWAVSLAALGVYIGFSKEVGAFLAGVAIASTPYKEVIAARLVSLRDFLLLFFFIDLGVGLDIAELGQQVLPALLFSAFVLIGNPIIVIVILGYMGYSKKTGFLAGLTVAQISEFSLLLAALGLSQGHISSETVGLITLVGLITISLSTYMILYSEQLYAKLAPFLERFERTNKHNVAESTTETKATYDIVIFGLGRLGAMIAEEFIKKDKSVLVVDLDMEKIRVHTNCEFDVLYGDMEALECINHLPLTKTEWVISTVRQVPENLALLYALKESEFKGKTAVFAETPEDFEIIKTKGVDRPLMPHAELAEKLAKSFY